MIHTNRLHHPLGTTPRPGAGAGHCRTASHERVRPVATGRGLFSKLAAIGRAWRADIQRAWRLPDLEECEADLYCDDCGKIIIQCRCSPGEGA